MLHRRSRSAGLVAAAAVAVALVLPMQSLAARSGTEPGAWAQGVCSAIVDWGAVAEAKANGIEKQLTGSLPQARAVLSRFLDEMVKETDRMITRIDVFGTPAVKSGTPIRQRLRTLLVAARSALRDGRDRAAKLSITDATAFQLGAGKISDNVDRQLTALGSGFDKLDRNFPSPELDRAVSKSPACAKL